MIAELRYEHYINVPVPDGMEWQNTGNTAMDMMDYIMQEHHVNDHPYKIYHIGVVFNPMVKGYAIVLVTDRDITELLLTYDYPTQ